MHFSSWLLLSSAGLAASEQGSNYNVSLATAATYQCGEKCYEILQATNAADLAVVGSDFDFDFYTVADNFTTSQPGDLLKLKPIDPTNLTVISGVSVYRIQYVSEDLDGSHVPVTGFIALPYSVPDSGEFPLVAYAHGTVGTYHGCAISNGPDLFDYDSWSLLSERGYAVVATDYAGLGPNYTEHLYCSFPAHANDVFYSVTAARQAFGAALSAGWLAVGHSQGGGAVWKLAENVDAIAAANGKHNEAARYLGTVALAPATKIWDMVQLVAAQVLPRPDFHAWSITSLLPYVFVGTRAVFPNVTDSILGDTMKARIGLTDEAQLCASGVLGLTLDLELDQLTSLSATGKNLSASDAALFAAFQDRMAPANGARSHGPMLVVQGVNDTAILAETTERAWEDACAAGGEVHLRLYPKQDHSGVIVTAASDWLKWIDARFIGRTTAGNCTRVTVKPFDYGYVKAELEVDLSSNSVN